MKRAAIRKTSAWPASKIERFLAETRIPVRLGCVDSSGAPLVCSVWYRFADDAIWCATQRGAKIVKLLRHEPRCAFEIAGDDMPYRGVRGQGEAQLIEEDGADVLAALIERYLGTLESDFARWLLARSDDEVAIRIDPEWLTSWDFSNRMPG